MDNEIISQIFWRLTIVLAAAGLLFLAGSVASFSLYNFTSGKIYEQLKQHPSLFQARSFVIALLFAIAFTAFDLPTILIAFFTDTPIDIFSLLMFLIAQIFLIVIVGSQMMWLSFRLAIPLAHKFLQRHFS